MFILEKNKKKLTILGQMKKSSNFLHKNVSTTVFFNLFTLT